MPKKNRKKNRVTDIFEKTEIESVEGNVESTEPVKAPEEAIPPDSTLQEEGTELPQSEDQPSNIESDPAQENTLPSDASTSHEEQTSTDDLLDDVRQSLIEDETVKDEKKSKKWWRRVAKGLQKDKKVETETPIETETTLSSVDAQADFIEEEEDEKKPEGYLDEIDELIDMLETESNETAAPVSTPIEVATEPEVEVDLEELKKQAFQPRSVSEEQENITEVRSVALEDGEEVFVEVKSTPQDPLEERLTALENALRPYRRYLYFGIAVLGVVMAVIASAVLFNIYRRSQPAAPTAV